MFQIESALPSLARPIMSLDGNEDAIVGALKLSLVLYSLLCLFVVFKKHYGIISGVLELSFFFIIFICWLSLLLMPQLHYFSTYLLILNLFFGCLLFMLSQNSLVKILITYKCHLNILALCEFLASLLDRLQQKILGVALRHYLFYFLFAYH